MPVSKMRRLKARPQMLAAIFEYHPIVMQLEDRCAPGDALMAGLFLGPALGMNFVFAPTGMTEARVVRPSIDCETILEFTDDVTEANVSAVRIASPILLDTDAVSTSEIKEPTQNPAIYSPESPSEPIVQLELPEASQADHHHSHATAGHSHEHDHGSHSHGEHSHHDHAHGDHSHSPTLTGGGESRSGAFDLAVIQLNSLSKVATVGNMVGITFGTVSQNVGTDPIPWLFTVKETSSTPWVAQNGLTWGHQHNAILNPPDPAPNTKYNNYYGQHPHVQLFLFSQPPGNTGLNNLKLIGKSDLKHGFKTADTNDEHGHHFLHPGNTDPYSATLNRNRSWYGPISEINPVTFEAGAHNHFGFLNGDGHYERNHGDAPNVPGDTEAPPNHANIIEHLLQVPVNAIDPAKIRPGTKLFVAASYFVVDDINLNNNTLYREINPTTFSLIGGQLPGRFIGPT